MPEFSINIGQSLVDKTLDQIPSYPYAVIKHPAAAIKTAELSDAVLEDVLPYAYDEFQLFGKKALEVINEEAESLEASTSGGVGTYGRDLSEYDEKKHKEYREKDLSSLTDEQQMELDKMNKLEESRDALILGAQISASYVVSNPANIPPELLQEAQSILAAEGFDKTAILGFGDFFRRVTRSVTRALSSIGRWFTRQIKKVIQIGNPTIENLVIEVMQRPSIKVGNPIIVNNLNLRVATIRVDVPYKIFGGKWKHVYFTFNKAVELQTSGRYALTTDKLKVYVTPRFDRVAIQITILGIKFTITLTSVANMILERVGKLEIYDASSLVTPIRVRDFKYTIEKIEMLNSYNSLQLDTYIKVSR